MKRSVLLRTVSRGAGLSVLAILLTALILTVVRAPSSWAATIQVTTADDIYDVGNPGGCGTVLSGDLPGGY